MGPDFLVRPVNTTVHNNLYYIPFSDYCQGFISGGSDSAKWTFVDCEKVASNQSVTSCTTAGYI